MTFQESLPSFSHKKERKINNFNYSVTWPLPGANAVIARQYDISLSMNWIVSETRSQNTVFLCQTWVCERKRTRRYCKKCGSTFPLIHCEYIVSNHTSVSYRLWQGDVDLPSLNWMWHWHFKRVCQVSSTKWSGKCTTLIIPLRGHFLHLLLNGSWTYVTGQPAPSCVWSWGLKVCVSAALLWCSKLVHFVQYTAQLSAEGVSRYTFLLFKLNAYGTISRVALIHRQRKYSCSNNSSACFPARNDRCNWMLELLNSLWPII